MYVHMYVGTYLRIWIFHKVYTYTYKVYTKKIENNANFEKNSIYISTNCKKAFTMCTLQHYTPP
jgi:hypothetical protein